jgi:hypothetical protein
VEKFLLVKVCVQNCVQGALVFLLIPNCDWSFTLALGRRTMIEVKTIRCY